MSIVQTGLYFGFNEAELLAELERYKAEVKAMSSRRLQGASVAGNSYTYGPNGDLSLEQWSEAIQTALSMVNPDGFSPPARFGVARF